MTFVRRYMSDKIHRLDVRETTVCGRKAAGEVLSVTTKLNRCGQCEDVYKARGNGDRPTHGTRRPKT